MKILDVKQGSAEWLQARLGVVTASEVDALVTPLWKPKTGAGPETYLYQKLAEKLVGYIPEFSGTHAMDLGSMAEKIALPWFNFKFDVEAKQVGFCVSDDGRVGCSPDALIGDDNGLEIKFPTPPKHLRYLLRGELPDDYKAQVHFGMFVTGRPRWTFCSFSTQFESFVLEVKRDDKIQTVLREVTEEFFSKFDVHYAKLKGTQDAENERLNKDYLAKLAKWEKTRDPKDIP